MTTGPEASEVLLVLLWATVTALATGLGALPFVFLRRVTDGAVAYANAIASGLMLGASFAVLCAEASNVQLFTLAMGAFCLGWALGYVTPFAPAGVGAREVGIAGILMTQVPAVDAFLHASVARIVWTCAELFLGGCALARNKLKTTSNNSPCQP